MRIQSDVSLKNRTTFKIGGRAKYFCEPGDEKGLKEAVSFAKKKNLQTFILGRGSNVVISDKGLGCLVIKLQNFAISKIKESEKFVYVKAEAGVLWDDLVSFSVRENLQGIECLSGIPGTVGAAPIQNIGAYGQELKNSFVELTAFDIKNEKFVKFDKKECQFGYRDSVFKRDKNKIRYIIFDVVLRLNKNKKPELNYKDLVEHFAKKKVEPSITSVRKAVLEIRKNKFEDPNEVGNAGSFFKNPYISKSHFQKLTKDYPDMPNYHNDAKVKVPAGWFIEKAGWKGKVYKEAAVSKRHALVLINPNGKAKASDIKKLSMNIKEDVFNKFKVILEPEAQFVGL